jgi:hypothetical protein
MRPTQLRYCACGATREAPAELRIVSCVRCGRALMTEPELPPAPPNAVAAVAVLASQLVGMLAFAVALAWGWRASGDGRIAIGAVVAVGALWVLAGGGALRGSLFALVCCAVLDFALALTCLAGGDSVHDLVLATTARIAPEIIVHADRICAGVGLFSALAAIMCIAAIPQVRRMAEWQDAQIARLALRT